YSESTLTVNSTEFDKNTAITNGGAIYASGETNIDHNTFANNTANDGGAIYSESTLTVNSTEFDKNTATNNGGAIYGTDAITITSSMLQNNEAINGGTIYALHETTEIKDSSIHGNKAEKGAVLYTQDGVANVSYATFSSNTATDKGGVFYIQNSNVTIENSTLQGNFAESGAAVASHGGTVNIMNSTLTANQSESDGGAIYSDLATTYHILNSIVYGNYANGIAQDIATTNQDILNMAYTLFSVSNVAINPTNFNNTQADISEIETIFENVENGLAQLSEDGCTVAIQQTGLAAYTGTLLGKVQDDYYYYNHLNNNWQSFTASTSTIAFDKNNTVNYGLTNGHVFKEAQNINADTGNHESRVSTLDAFNAGAYALTVSPIKDEFVSVSTDWIINPFSQLSSLRERVEATPDHGIIGIQEGLGEIVLKEIYGPVVINVNVTFADGFTISGYDENENILEIADGTTTTFGSIILNNGILQADNVIFSNTTGGTGSIHLNGAATYTSNNAQGIFEGHYEDGMTLSGSGIKTLQGDISTSSIDLQGTADNIVTLDGANNTINIDADKTTATYATINNTNFSNMQTLHSYDDTLQTNTIVGDNNSNLNIYLTADSIKGSDLVFGIPIFNSIITATYNIRGEIITDTNGAIYGIISTQDGQMPNVVFDENGLVIEQTVTAQLDNDHENYTLTNTTFDLKILNRALTLTIDGNNISKIYDGTTNVELQDQIYYLDILNEDDVIAVGTWSYDNKHVGDANKTVTFENIKLIGHHAGNYRLLNTSAVTHTATITHRPITVKLDGSKISKVYDFSLEVKEENQKVAWFTDKVAGDNIYLSSGSWTYTDMSFGLNNKTVILSNIVLAGADRHNYFLTSTTAITNNATITQGSSDPSDDYHDSFIEEWRKNSLLSTKRNLWAHDPFEFGDHFGKIRLNDTTGFLFPKTFSANIVQNSKINYVTSLATGNELYPDANTKDETLITDPDTHTLEDTFNQKVDTEHTIQNEWQFQQTHMRMHKSVFETIQDTQIAQRDIYDIQLAEESIHRLLAFPHKSTKFQSKQEQLYSALGL
ncbi:MAG TPA: YDG domain-containing protein, partial [Planctomycetota bacterium]|nr:YDG domain-containing protein [Planctomycetota bacterium]